MATVKDPAEAAVATDRPAAPELLSPEVPFDASGLAGHPRGLTTLFFTEMWERFSYYGMRAFLILYLIAPVSTGGMGFSAPEAASIYGTYTGSAWGAAILGGFLADRVMGQYYAVLLGGILIALAVATLMPIPGLFPVTAAVMNRMSSARMP